MLEEFIKNKVYYKIFDLSSVALTHQYIVKDFKNLVHVNQIKKNIEFVINEFEASKLLLLNQVHGNKIVTDENFTFDELPVGDGAITTKKNIILGIRTADCVPVLLASKDGSIIGGAHCGWRSAKCDIIKYISYNMRQKGAKNLQAIIGPSIAWKSYEVSNDFYRDFINDSKTNKQFFVKGIRTGHYMFDLIGFVKLKLAEAEVEIFKHITEDTYSMRNKYPSFRRHTHTGEKYYQNILSTVVIK